MSLLVGSIDIKLGSFLLASAVGEELEHHSHKADALIS